MSVAPSIKPPPPFPIATEALPRISELYRIEAQIHACPADKRRAMRQDRSRPVMGRLEPQLREKLGLISRKSKLAGPA